MKILLFMLILLIPERGNDTVDSYIYIDVDKQPVLKYENGFYSYVNKNLKWPKNFGYDGVVIVSFIVTKTGDVEQINIERKLCTPCDNEVIRVLDLMPKWEPGEIDGKKVDVKFYLPIEFKLTF